MPFRGSKYYHVAKNAGKLWKKDAKGQGFGSLYGGNQTSDITRNTRSESINDDVASDFPN